MNLSIIRSLILVQLFIDNFSLEVIACNSLSRIDSISYLYYRGIAYVLTSNGYYYIIYEKDIENNVNEYGVSGKIPDLLHNCCDSAVIKDIDECEQEEHNEHSIAFLKYTSGESKYISLNITSLLKDENVNIWSKAKSVINDVILSNANIDYSRKVDAIFNTDNAGELFFIQGEHYSGMEFQDSCPQMKNQITVFEKHPLSELDVHGKIDSAYYEQNRDGNHFLYLLHYDQMQFFKVEINRPDSKDGKLVKVKTTEHPISSHPILSKICAHNRYNSSHLSAEQPSIDISSDVLLITSHHSLISVIFSFIFWYLINY